MEEKKKEKLDLGSTSCGMKAELAAALSYVLGFVTGIIFFIIEKKNKFVRFHAMQSIILFASILVLQVIFIPILWIPVIGWLPLIAGFILWIILLIKASQGVYFKLPGIGNIAEKNAAVKQ